MSKVLGGSFGGERFLMGEVPLYRCAKLTQMVANLRSATQELSPEVSLRGPSPLTFPEP